jgi:hypothetical protein
LGKSRAWPESNPTFCGSGRRSFPRYRRKDVEQVLEIKRLLYEKRYTIEGARKFLENRGKPDPASAAPAAAKPGRRKGAQAQAGLFDVPSPVMQLVRKELKEIVALLK